MKNYTNYEIEDFLLDDLFIEWVKYPHAESEKFWQSWLQQHPDRVEIVSQARQLAIAVRIQPGKELTDSEVNELMNQVHKRHERYQESPQSATLPLPWYQQKWLRMAASILLVVGLSWWIYRQNSDYSVTPTTNTSLASLTAQKNQTSRPILVRLPDGSSVVLQPGSNLHFDRSFSGEKREVYLTGEAFFEVTKNPNRPFLVYTHEVVTKVIGTSFSVKANEADDHIKVVVATGKVSVSTQEESQAETGTVHDASEEVLLTPNQQATFYRKQVRLVKEIVRVPSLLSERVAKDQFNFVQTPLVEVLSTLEEAYGVDIVYNEKVMTGCLLTASLTDQPLYDKLTIISKAVNARIEMTAGKIVLDGPGCLDIPASGSTTTSP